MQRKLSSFDSLQLLAYRALVPIDLLPAASTRDEVSTLVSRNFLATIPTPRPDWVRERCFLAASTECIGLARWFSSDEIGRGPSTSAEIHTADQGWYLRSEDSAWHRDSLSLADRIPAFLGSVFEAFDPAPWWAARCGAPRGQSDEMEILISAGKVVLPAKSPIAHSESFGSSRFRVRCGGLKLGSISIAGEEGLRRMQRLYAIAVVGSQTIPTWIGSVSFDTRNGAVVPTAAPVTVVERLSFEPFPQILRLPPMSPVDREWIKILERVSDVGSIGEPAGRRV